MDCFVALLLAMTAVFDRVGKAESAPAVQIIIWIKPGSSGGYAAVAYAVHDRARMTLQIWNL